MMKVSKIDQEIRDIRKKSPNTWDPSMTHSVHECARLFYFTYIRNIGIAEEPDYFCSGRAWDAAMGAFDKEGNLRIRYEAAVKAIHSVYDKTSCNRFHPKRTRESLLQLLERYIVMFPTSQYEVLASNLPLSIPLSDDLFLGGELDKYMEWPPYGLVIGETKTSLLHSGTKNWDGYMAQFKLGGYGHQITHYNYIVERTTGKKPWGTCVFTACLDIPARETTRRDLFSKIWVEHSEAKTQDWLDCIHLADAKAKWCWDNWTWPMQGQKCTGAWGTMPCAFRYICMLPAHLHELETVPSIYVPQGEWAPWKGVKRS